MSLRNRIRLGCQRGFTTVTLMGVLGVGGIAVAASFAAVQPDIKLTRANQDSKQAYAAAEAGLQWYLNRLGQDNNFYLKCSDPTLIGGGYPPPVNKSWNGVGADPRVWRKVSGEKDAEYTVELLAAPASSTGQCIAGDQFSMVDADGNMRLRVTGRSRDQVRTVRATMRRRNFIDFIYFTHFETLDPAAYSTSASRTWAETNCNTFRAARNASCTEIQFASSDVITGPFHTNDNVRLCSGATFGRNANDSVEISGTPPFVSAGCGNTPNLQGTLVNPASQLAMPPSNTLLKTIAGRTFTGVTRLVINGGTMTVTNNGSTTTEPIPSNGVIYVESSSCPAGYSRSQTYTSTPAGCGDVWVQGSYGTNLTIAAENDVVISEDLTRGNPDVLLGLVANNFVRVYHPVTFGSGTSCTNNYTAGDLRNVQIDAAILALGHSFIVDNWHCGAQLGTLDVEGAIAQRYRGPVGTTAPSGYIKDYSYNDRLRYREPPYFLDPIQSQWRIARETEQVPPVK